MNKQLLRLLVSVLLAQPAFAQQNSLILWYRQPAKDWNEALPVGNGRLGAMIFGRVAQELIQLNEETLWTGSPVSPNPNPEAPQYLQPVRDALFKDSIGQAVRLLRKMQGPNTEMYQPLGDIILRQELNAEPTGYSRNLNISNATSTTRFTVSGVEYTREIFSSAPDQIIIIHITASKPNALNFSIGVNHELKFDRVLAGENEIVLKGKARINNDERRNIKPLFMKTVFVAMECVTKGKTYEVNILSSPLALSH